MREEGQEERAREEARKDDGGESQRGEGRGWCVWVSERCGLSGQCQSTGGRGEKEGATKGYPL
jgi:hypothetical protein